MFTLYRNIIVLAVALVVAPILVILVISVAVVLFNAAAVVVMLFYVLSDIIDVSNVVTYPQLLFAQLFIYFSMLLQLLKALLLFIFPSLSLPQWLM